MFFTERALKVTESETNQVIKLFFSNIFREDLSVYVWTCVTLTLISSPPRLHSCLNVCHTRSFSFSSREFSNFLSPPGDTDLSSALFTSTHSALSLTIQQRVFFFFGFFLLNLDLCLIPGKQEAGHSSLGSRSGSVRLPDGVQDLDHFLIDDENYGHVQTDTAQTRDCPFIETRQKKRDNVTKMRHPWCVITVG